MIEYEAAIDEIFAEFNESWIANSTVIVGYIPQIIWQGKEEGDIPSNEKFWCRVSQQTVIESQATLSDENSSRRYTTEGLVFVQLFCPMSDSANMTKGRLLAKLIKSAFRGKKTAGGVWFRNSTIRELTPENSYNRFNVITEYQYDEIG